MDVGHSFNDPQAQRQAFQKVLSQKPTGAEVAARQMQNKGNVVVFAMPEQINPRGSAAGRRVNGRCQPPETENSTGRPSVYGFSTPQPMVLGAASAGTTTQQTR
jgi:hypothetical protein